jgi:hypothetical protein
MMPSTHKSVVLSDNQQACLFSSYYFNACTSSQYNWLQAKKGTNSGTWHTWLDGNCTDDINFASAEPSAQHPPPYFPTIHHCIITLIKAQVWLSWLSPSTYSYSQCTMCFWDTGTGLPQTQPSVGKIYRKPLESPSTWYRHHPISALTEDAARGFIHM